MSTRATITASMRPLPSWSNTSPASAGISTCRSTHAAATRRDRSGSASPRSRTARPLATASWHAESVAVSARATSAASSAIIHCRSSSPVIAWSDSPGNSPATPAASTASAICSNWRWRYPPHLKGCGSPPIMKPPFEKVVAQHGATVLRVVRAVLGPADADDAWSDTFLAAMKAYPDLPADANLEAWLVTIAHRKAIDITRATSRRAIPIPDAPDRPSHDHADGRHD